MSVKKPFKIFEALFQFPIILPRFAYSIHQNHRVQVLICSRGIFSQITTSNSLVCRNSTARCDKRLNNRAGKTIADNIHNIPIRLSSDPFLHLVLWEPRSQCQHLFYELALAPAMVEKILQQKCLQEVKKVPESKCKLVCFNKQRLFNSPICCWPF